MSEEKVNEQTGEIVHVDTPVVDVVEYDPKNPVSIYMNGSVFHQVGLVARTMSQSELVPAHLRGKPADCFLIVAQAVRWQMDPFAVAQSCYVARGKVGYEGKLIAGLINAKLGKPLNYEYEGEGNARRVRVFGTLKGETSPREITGTLADWRTQNEQWKTMPDQMLSYRGAREWARRHMPEAVLGIYSDDEVKEIERVEAKSEIGDVVDGILGGDVTTEDDPPPVERASQSAQEAPQEAPAPAPDPEPASAPKKVSQARKKADAKKGPKPAPKPEPVPEPVPEPEGEASEDEIEALFS